MYVCMYALITVDKNGYTCSNPTYGVAARSLPTQQDPYIIEYSIPYIHTRVNMTGAGSIVGQYNTLCGYLRAPGMR